MGIRRAARTGWPTWLMSVGAMLEHQNGFMKGEPFVKAYCSECARECVVDLVKIIEAKGPDYSLIDRRCRCKLTPGCPGWNRFIYLLGVYRPLWHEQMILRWMEPPRSASRADSERGLD